jgi:hypothetical protein
LLGPSDPGAFSVSLTTNNVARLGPFHAVNDFSFGNQQDLTIAGPVGGANTAINTDGNLAIAAPVSGNNVALSAAGAIVENGGAITANVLSLQAGSTALNAANAIRTLGPAAVQSNLQLTNAQPLAIDGPLTARAFAITAPGSITLNGGVITTEGLPDQSGAVPVLPGSFFLVTPSNGSGFFEQNGTTIIQPSQGASSATVRIDAPASGAIRFANLIGPQANLVLGGTGAAASGFINVRELTVLVGTGSSTLLGVVGGASGPQAAAIANALPAPNAAYLLNGCPIGLPNCGIIIPPGVTGIANLQLVWPALNQQVGAGYDLIPELVSSTRVHPETLSVGVIFPPAEPKNPEPSIILPNVSSRDY